MQDDYWAKKLQKERARSEPSEPVEIERNQEAIARDKGRQERNVAEEVAREQTRKEERASKEVSARIR